MDVSCITTRQIVYEPVDIPSPVSESGLESLSHLRSLAYASIMKDWALGSGVCIYTYLGGTPSIWDAWAPSLRPGGTCGVPGGCGVSPGVSCLSRPGGGAPVSSHLQHDWGFCAVPSWQVRKPSVWLSRIIAVCVPIAVFTFLCQANWTPFIFSSRTWARRFLIRHCVSSIVAHENPLLAIFTIFKARDMSDCTSCTWPPCLAIVAGTLKFYNNFIAASTYQIRLLPLPYTVL